MDMDRDICYRALRSRDRRFDGRFFTGVTSTGIYCRPICPARTPRADRCVFFACAAAAEEAGFRPCRRCRPETAPGTPAWRGSSATVTRALRLIESGALDEGGVEDLAERLGAGGRHLRRLFQEQLGASPLAVANTRRAHFAKRLVEETDLPMAQIAFAAGYGSVRRFNAALRASFDRTPREIRRLGADRARGGGDGAVELKLSYRVPLDWRGLLAYLSPRAIPGVEQIAGGVYRRSIELSGFAGLIEVSAPRGEGEPLRLRLPAAALSDMARVAEKVRDLFDLNADPAIIREHLARDPCLAALARRQKGLRVPGAWDRFELAVRAILGQQITVAGATRLAGRLVQLWGRPLDEAGEVADRNRRGRGAPRAGPAWLFPRPEVLAEADIARIGMPAARAEALRALARAVARGEPVLELAGSLDEAVGRLVALPGIGEWTAQYIALRALGEPDAFPAGDLGLRRAMATGDRMPTAAALRKRAETWRPWRGYAAMLLWRSQSQNTREEK